ncbi:hypothetical protein Maes01_00986 [Microbulbifer aestuariivivens]|uniref:D-glutamate cyclase-like C-terminal domain-containing protein n=1 Tax=Microbulbifer aestuariivivens TaxID=1908308 RepID=A0ABP9WMU2_9GAMM
MHAERLPADAAILRALALDIEERLVSRDQRGMGRVRSAWQTGYLHSAVQTLLQRRARVMIVSGFPVGETFETDGPAGALVLASALRALGSEVRLVGLADFVARLRQGMALLGLDERVAIAADFSAGASPDSEPLRAVQEFAPTLVVFVEVPGVTADGNYYNMRGDNISARTLPWEALLSCIDCPTLAFADGGNEVGMGRVKAALRPLDIEPAVSVTDHLVISDVSNWGVYGAVALASAHAGRDLFPGADLRSLLQALNRSGIVDGVTRQATPTEDGLDARQGQRLIAQLRQLAAAIMTPEPAADATPAAGREFLLESYS